LERSVCCLSYCQKGKYTFDLCIEHYYEFLFDGKFSRSTKSAKYLLNNYIKKKEMESVGYD
jgi:hypothetical protein